LKFSAKGRKKQEIVANCFWSA